jgi:exo-beta-1,3-glucanase (GH17 family)
MLHKSNARLYLSLSLFVGACLGATLLWGLRSSQTARSQLLASTYPISIVPDQMMLTGDVTTRANCVQPTCSWPENNPTGTIMLGVDPTSPNTSAWDGGIATAEVFLPNVYTQTVVVLKLSWPDRDGKGLRSSERNRLGAITLDGRRLWDKRTTDLSTSTDYYAAEHEPILMTIALTQSITHTLSFSVSAHTAWDLSQIELTAYPYPTATKGIGYSPFRDCQYPGGASQPSVQDIKEDLFRLSHTSNAIRTYSAMGVNGQIPAMANEIGLRIFAGAWIDGNPEDDNDEVEALIDLACESNLEGVIVGNEYYLRHRSEDAIEYLLQRIGQVREGIRTRCGRDVPITTAEIDNLIFGWEGAPPTVITGIQSDYLSILDEVDFVMVHTYPFWSGMPIDGAAAFTVDRYKAMRALIEQQGKWVIFGEVGWPSGGESNGRAVPSPRNQQKYMLEFLPLAEQEGVEFMYFDAFDELWKIEEPGHVGQHWGYSYTDRSAKYSFYGVLLPVEQLPFPPPPLSHTVYLPYVARSDSDARRFHVYSEWPEVPGHFVPSGWMGDIGNITLFECDRCDPHSGEMAIRASFSATGTLGWGGIYWQYPANNWGNIGYGLDLRGADRLTFWARSEASAWVKFLIGGIGYPVDHQGRADCAHPSEPYPDSVCPKIERWVLLSPDWTEHTIDLHQYSRDLSKVVGGFGWVAENSVTFYLDDVVYEFD